MRQALAIFVKNIRKGAVKTRIAATAGEDRALVIYRHLLDHTRSVSLRVKSDKFVFYSDQIDADDIWSCGNFGQELQHGTDLGARMHHAFTTLFDKGYDQVVIIGSDCLQLTENLIAEAFAALNGNEVVLGPSTDGGYYLIGLSAPAPFLFSDMPWSTPDVLRLTLTRCDRAAYACHLLPERTDIDTEQDWIAQTGKL